MRTAATCGAIAILALAALIATPMIREGFWCDEGFSIAVARAGSPAEFFHDIRIGDPHPPLFNALLAVVGRAARWEEIPIKLFALVWGLLSIAGIMAAAWQLTGRSMAGVLAGAIALHSPLVTSHLAEARGYAMSVAFLTFGIATLRRRPMLATVLLSLACWSHYIALVAVVSCGLIALVLRWRDVARANLIAAATTLPLLPLMLGYASTGLPHEHRPSLLEALAVAQRKIGFALPHADFAPAPAGAIALVAIVLLPLFVLPSLGPALRPRAHELALPAAYALPVLAIFGPLGTAERYVLIGAALLCIIIAVLLIALDDAAKERPRVRIAFRSILGAYFVLSLGSVAFDAPVIIEASRHITKSGTRTLARAADFGAEDVILVAPDALAPTVVYYAPSSVVAGFPQWDKPQITEMAKQNELWMRPDGPAVTAMRLKQLIAQRHPRRVFFICTAPPYGRQQMYDLRAELLRRFNVTALGTFAGRVETINAYGLTPR